MGERSLTKKRRIAAKNHEQRVVDQASIG